MAEDIAIKMHHAALIAGLRQIIRNAFDKTSARIGNHQLHAPETAIDEMPQKRGPAGFVLLGALTDAEDLPEPLGIDRRGHQQRDVANLTSPAALHHDAVEVEIRMLAFDPAIPPRLDLGIDLLVQVRHCARADPGCPTAPP